MDLPEIGSLWQHPNGNEYKVILLTNLETRRPRDYPVTVVYQNIHNGNIWSRKAENWHEAMTELHRWDMGIGNTNKVVEPVKVEEEDKSSPFGGMSYSHPSYGIARFSRISGERGRLYGSKINSSNTIDLTISTSKCRQDLGRDWYYDKDEVINVTFTQTQFAELLTNMNASGVPCTINYREALGRIEFAEMPHELEYIKETILTKQVEQKEKLRTLQKEANGLLIKTGTLKKADKERLIEINRLIVNLAESALPFYAESAEKTIRKATQEGKAEIEAFNLHAVTTLGLKVLEDIDLVKNLLENKD